MLKKFQGLKEAKRDLIVTNKRGLFLIGREAIKSGPNRGQITEAVSRHIQLNELWQVIRRF